MALIRVKDINHGQTIRIKKKEFSKREYELLTINYWVNYMMIVDGEYLIITRK
ncbi:MAG: hypothetical protein K0R54_572 [Clostridiaceae bacterium]|jgi:hypothetical protein|nr:hypothetical protein [Clostridiaceae bacterium]